METQLTPNELAEAGRALYGGRWQTALAHDLHVTDRTIRRWLVGAFPIPATVKAEVRAALFKRVTAVGDLIGVVINPNERLIIDYVTNAAFRYDDNDVITQLHPGFARPDELPPRRAAVEEALRQQRSREARGFRGGWADPRTGRII